jgi:hypothetical protein
VTASKKPRPASKPKTRATPAKKTTTKKTTTKKTTTKKRASPAKACAPTKHASPQTYDAASSRERAYAEAAAGRLLHDESEADEDGFIAGAGFDRYGGFPGDGMS